MAKFTNTKSLGYDDVVLIAQPAVIESRKEIPIEGWRIVVSAMTSIVGPHFLEALSKLPQEYQPTVHIPRDIHAEKNLRLARELGLENIFVGVGLYTPKLEELAKELGYVNLLLYVANGYLPQVKEKVKNLKKQGFRVCTGSVHTDVGAKDLIDVGCNIVRSGIGPGSVCITSATAGYTRSPITDILALTTHKTWSWDEKKGEVAPKVYQVLADGGIKNPADTAKAFLAGADYIMSGRLFVDAKEARLRVDGSDVYYGMASALGKAAMGKKVEHVEGKVQKLPRDNMKPLQDIIFDLWDGLRSAVSYSGHDSLASAIGNGVFEIKQSK